MDKNLQYIQHVKIEDLPWNRLTTAYVRATAFPEYFATIENMSNKSKVKSALREILRNIEHQSTLWRATPFSMIFLVRIFKKAVAEMNDNAAALLIVEELLWFFKLIAELFHETEQYKAEQKDDTKPLPYFGDMLREEFLFPEESDDEEEEAFWEEDVEKSCDEMFEQLWYSFYYYSYQVILTCKTVLEKIDNSAFKEEVQQLQNLL